jgi:hypothetical protein
MLLNPKRNGSVCRQRALLFRRNIHSDSSCCITKQGLKLGLVVADKTSSAVKGIGRGLAEVGESFTDVLAEARADLAQPSKAALAEPSKAAK